MNIKAKA
jgi:hypothetical protein